MLVRLCTACGAYDVRVTDGEWMCWTCGEDYSDEDDAVEDVGVVDLDSETCVKS